MRQILPMHGRTHKMGGSDPVPFELSYCFASNDGNSQTVTANEELEFQFAVTNDRNCFAWDDADDPDGILILKRGLYCIYSYVCYSAGSVSVPRDIYSSVQPLSSGALAGVGNEYGEIHFALGPGQAQSGVSSVTASSTIPKFRLDHIAMQLVEGFDFQTDPPRAAVILQHLGTNYTVTNLASTMTVVRMGDVGGEPPDWPLDE